MAGRDEPLRRFRMSHKSGVALALLLFVALAGRLLYLSFVDPMPVRSDASGYDASARRLLATGTYAFPVGHTLWADDVFREEAWLDFATMRPNAWCMPGYAWFLAGIYRVAGTGPERFEVVRVVQALLGTLTVAMMFLLADRLLGRRAAWLALVLAAAYPPSFRSMQYLLTETLFTLLLACQILLMVWAARSRRGPAFVCLGLVTVAATYVRPIALFVPGLLLGLEMWRWLRAPSRREPLVRPVVRFVMLGLTIAVLLTPWWVRNHRLYDDLFPLGTAAELSLAQGELFAHGRMFRHETTAQFARLEETDYDDHRYAQAAATRIRQDLPPATPSEWVGIQVVKMRMLASALATPFSFFSHPVPARDPELPMQVGLLALAALGLWRCRRDAETVMLIGGLAVYVVAVQWVAAMLWSRYLYPVMPFLLALAAAGVVGRRGVAAAPEAPLGQPPRPKPGAVVPRLVPRAGDELPVAASTLPPRLRYGPIGLVALAGVGLFTLLLAELPAPPAYSNDIVLHLSLARGLVENRTLDFWHFTDLGYPALRLYQPFYHLALALFHGASGGALGLPWLVQLLLVGLALGVPAGVYVGARRWLEYEGLAPNEARWAAAVAALLGALSSSFSGFGYDPLQGIYSRYGVITQTWSMVFFVPAFAWTVGFLTGRTRSPWAGLALSFLVWGFSMIVGVMHALCIALRTAAELLARRDPRAVLRAGGYFLGLAIVTAFLWWPLVADSPWVNYPRPFIARWVNEGLGYSAALGALFSGTLLDGASLEARGRWPVMSALMAIGVVPTIHLWRTHRPLSLFLLAGQVFWFSLFVGRDAWGGLLYMLPLLRSYQWGRVEAMLQFWATIIAALGVVRLSPSLWARLPGPGRALLAAVGLAGVVLLAALPVAKASFSRSIIEQARTGGGGRLVSDLATRLRGETTRTYVGGPTTWERRLVADQILTGVALTGEGVAVAGRMYQGMNYASALVYLWDGATEWGASLLSVGHWLAPCDDVPHLPVARPATEAGPGICLADARSAPPLAFFSTLAATRVHALTEDQIVTQQRALLAAPGADGFLPFRPGATAAIGVPESFGPLRPWSVSGARFGPVAPGVASSRLHVEVPTDGAVVFPVPFHPRLQARVDGLPASPVAVIPGYAAVAVRAGTHDVTLTYRTDRVRDGLFLLALFMLAVGALTARGRRRTGAPPGP